MSRFVNRKSILLLIITLLVAVLSGCAPTGQTHTTDSLLQQGGFWKGIVLYNFSKLLDTFAGWFGGEYWVAILLLTIVIRTAILPLSLKQYRSSKAMQALQPELQKIRDKYKDDMPKQQEETMKLFQENNVNPLAGCLPLLIQMPIFIALYGTIQGNEAFANEKFLGIALGTNVSDGVWWAYSLALIAALTTFIQTKMMQNANSSQQQLPLMQIMLFVFPIMIFVFSISLHAALPLYWVFSNLYTITQNYFLYVRNAQPAVIEQQPAKRKGSSKK